MNQMRDFTKDYAISILPIGQLRPTEDINVERADCLSSVIQEEGHWIRPIMVEQSCSLVMDGHHRLYCAARLGLSHVPCIILSYEDPHLTVTSWCDNQHYDIARIFRAGLSGERLGFKSTRHHLSADVPDCRIALNDLRRGKGDAAAD